MEFKLGQRVRDEVTGYEGMVTGFCTYITGCDQYLVQPRLKGDGSVNEPRWTDVDRLVLVDQAAFELPGEVRRKGEASSSAKRPIGPDKPAPIR